jgi:branched-subunit amino acid aminotransferase/4-amino-4-deoxychorismate lyase
MRLLVNGSLQSGEPTLPYSTALLRGDGLFETILAVDENTIAWDRHYARLSNSAGSLLITLPAKIDIELGISKVLKDSAGQSRMRLTVLSDGNWFISVEKLEPSTGAVSLMKVLAPKISSGGLSGVKSISYGQSLLVVRQAQDLGFDDGVFINEKGEVVETALSNLLILTSTGWLTPSLSSGCLPGITRELLIKWFDVKEELITFDQLLAAEAVYVTSSLRLIQRVSKVENKLFDESLVGKELITDFTKRLLSNINP